ncbi:AAA family ATPase [Nocardioides ultimimeridianus]
MSRVTVDWLRDAPDRIHQRLTGSLVSADLSGFTAMSERLAVLGREGAERLTGIVNGCFEALIAIADSEGGDVLKFGGDALLIWFPGADSALAAARAAARMQQTIRAPRFSRIGLRMSVGGHFGEFDLFLVGEPSWRELVLAGAPVTRTVELESAAGAGQVLVSPELASYLPEGWRGPATDTGILLDPPPLRRPRGVPEPDAGPTPLELISPSLREDIRALAQLGGEHRLATISFVEFEGTDHRLEEIGPAGFARSLDSLVRATQHLQGVYGVQFLYSDVIGNGVKLIATAGAPRSTVNDDEAALRFTVDLVHGDRRHKLKGGVNRGRVFAGFLGSPLRRTYTVMGDPVNLAARLMAKAEPGQVVAAADVLDHAHSEIRARELPPFLVKGKAQPIKAHVIDEVGAELLTANGPGDLPLVGREAEMARLSEWVGDVAAGRGRAVVVSGPAGIGKSRLIDEVAADDRLFTRVTVLCQPYSTSTPYAAARVVLRRLLGIQHSATPELAGQVLQRTVARVRPGLLPLLPLLAVPIGAVVAPTAEADAIAEEFVLPRTYDAVLELLTVMVATPTLIVAEDAYYADEASAGLFRAMALAIADYPWLLIAAARPGTAGVLDAGEEVDRIERLELEPLAPEAAAELATTALGDAAGPADLAAADRADGNPLFVLQLMEAVRAGVEADDLPESVERVIAERLDRLAPDDRTLLRYAAVLGPRFDVRLLDIVLKGAGQVLPDDVTWDRLGDLVEPESEKVRRFRHLLYRDVAYEALPFRPRAKLHQQVGELLEASSYADDVALLAEHFFRAGDHERTWRYSVAAGDRAWRQMAVAEAIAAYARAVGVRGRVRGVRPVEVGRVFEVLGDAYERSAQYERAESSYRASEKTRAGELGLADQSRLIRKRGMLRERTGRFRQGIRWYGRGQVRLRELGATDVDPALLVATAACWERLGEYERHLDLAIEASRVAVSIGDRRTEAHACALAQYGFTVTGRNRDLEYGLRAVSIFEELNDAAYQGKALNNVAIARYYSGDWIAASRDWRTAAGLLLTAGDVMEAATVRNNLGEILSDQGRLDEAVAAFESALGTWSAAGYPLGCAVATSNIGRAHARMGRGPGAMTALASALGSFERLQARAFELETSLRIAESHLLSGDTAAAAEVIRSVETAVGEGHSFPGSDAFLARLNCWRTWQLGNAEAALTAAQKAVLLAEEGGARFERAVSLNDAAVLSGDPAVLAEAEAELAALGVVRLPALPVPL